MDERLRSERAREALNGLPLVLVACLVHDYPPLPSGVEIAAAVVVMPLLVTAMVVPMLDPWRAARGRTWTSPVRVRDGAAGS